MNAEHEMIQKLRGSLPKVRSWIENEVERSRHLAQPVSTRGFQQLPRHFPRDLLERAQFVLVPVVQFPPLSSMGLPEFKPMEQMPLVGITFGSMFFVRNSEASESIFAHELVHVLQWERLGFDNFLLAYGLGLIRHGYQDSPFEQMAYIIQRNLERGVMPADVARVVNERTDAVWKEAAPLFG